MIQLDTNFLIRALVANSPQDHRLREWISAREPLGISAMVWAEFLCGPMPANQLDVAMALFPQPEPLLGEDARRGAELYNATGRRRGSLADCLIAATCLRLRARLATENVDDFRRFETMGLQVLTAG
jgi:predicted nucleic acid-binding protein